MSSFCNSIQSGEGKVMNEHRIFKGFLRPLVMMIVGLDYILKDLQLAVVAGIVIYAAAVWGENSSSSGW